MLPTTFWQKVSRHHWLTDIFALSAMVLLFYFLWLGSYPLFTPDEGRYSEIAREMIAAHDYITPRLNGVAFLDKPILYYWLQAIAMLLFGVKEWALRLFPVLFGLLGCIVTYVCGRHLFDRRTGLLSTIILATTPLYFGGAHYANLDLEVAVLISCALLCFFTAIQSTHQSRGYFFFVAYLCSSLAFLTKGMIGIVFPCLIGGTWIIIMHRLDLLKKIHIAPGIILFLVIVLPWYILVQRANPEFLHYFFVTQQVARFLSAGHFNNEFPMWFYLPVILIGFLPWTFFIVQTLKKYLRCAWIKPQQYQKELFLLLWIGIVLVFFSIPHSKSIGYILPVFPALALLVGSYFAASWDAVKPRKMYLACASFGATGLLIFILLLVTPHTHWINLLTGLIFCLSAIASVFILSAAAIFLCRNKRSLLPLFSICASCSVICLLIVTLNATHLNQNSAKSLVVQLKNIMGPQDEVVNYFKFYQDVPLYLGKRVTLVANWDAAQVAYRDNWVRELWYGMAFQKTDDWLINEDTFWQRWESDKHVFVFVNSNYLDKFKERAKYYYNVGKNNDIILLSNKPLLTE